MSEAMQNERINEILANGETLFNMGLYSELAEICREIAHEANDDRVYSMLSGAEFALGDYNSAENSARLGLVLNPGSLDNMYNLAWIINQKGEYAKALHYFICAKQLAEDDEVSAACAEEISKLEELTGITAAEASDYTVSPLSPCINNEIIVLTDVYPSETSCANMFVHARIKQYQKRGLNLRVFSFTKDKVRRVREYDGVEVIEGDLGVLQKFLEDTVVKLLLVHFLYIQMWNIIKPHLNKLNVIVFCHGWEIQPWYRREFNYKPEELEAEKQKSSVRMQLWSDVFSTALGGAGIHFVFVSQYFADVVMEDHGIALPDMIYSVIHNVIDTDLFKYTEKDPEQRKRMLLLGSFSSPAYGRDIAINAILKLSEHEEFSDMEFCVAGTGLLWDELTKPLETLKNVELINRFFTHDEILTMQQYYGIAMCPTRLDTHGVSRDEAMSCGLVPVTNAITAIPEFVDDECGMLCPPDDVNAFAEAILKLYHNPELFKKLSENAASRVRRQSSPEIVIEKEMELFNEMIDKPPRVGIAHSAAAEASIWHTDYWEKRYEKGGNSGAGSYGRLAEFKAEIVKRFIKENSIKSVIELGCGDGNQTALTYDDSVVYLGLDISQTVIGMNIKKFENDANKDFMFFDTMNTTNKNGFLKADCAVSLDVIYHLVDDAVYEKYMDILFGLSRKYVIIYSSDIEQTEAVQHCKSRNFTKFVERNYPNWELAEYIANRYPADYGPHTGWVAYDQDTSMADFYLYKIKEVMLLDEEGKLI